MYEAKPFTETATNGAAGAELNYPASVFRQLTSQWHQDSAAPRVDVLAAELAACMADAQGSLCLGLVRREAVSRLYGLVYLLAGYGLLLRQRYRERGDGVYIFLDRFERAESEFAGATVHEFRLEAALPRAA